MRMQVQPIAFFSWRSVKDSNLNVWNLSMVKVIILEILARSVRILIEKRIHELELTVPNVILLFAKLIRIFYANTVSKLSPPTSLSKTCYIHEPLFYHYIWVHKLIFSISFRNLMWLRWLNHNSSYIFVLKRTECVLECVLFFLSENNASSVLKIIFFKKFLNLDTVIRLVND